MDTRAAGALLVVVFFLSFSTSTMRLATDSASFLVAAAASRGRGTEGVPWELLDIYRRREPADFSHLPPAPTQSMLLGSDVTLMPWG